jgi:hypothetical protein
MDLYPYAAVPENRFEANIALQYGADFKVRFSRNGTHSDKVGLVQLIFPRTQIFPTTIVGAWNVDKGVPDPSPITLGRCLYGNDQNLIGAHSTYYQGQHMRSLAEGECWLIDTPREINGQFAGGVFTGVTSTKFANYVVELSSQSGVIFNQGMIWGYSVVQNEANPAQFDYLVQEPIEVLLSKTHDHRTAMAAFLGVAEDTLKGWISGV